MSNVIAHPDIFKFATIRQDYVAIVEDHAAALMLSIVEGWTDWLKKNGRSLWVDLSGNEFVNSVAGLFSRKKFMAAGKLLEDLGLVARKQKSDTDRTYQYLLQVGVVQERLNLLTFWNTCLKYVQLISTSVCGSFLKLNVQLLKALLEAIVPNKSLQKSEITSCIVPEQPTSKDVDKKFLRPTTTEVVVEKEVSVDRAEDITSESSTPETMTKSSSTPRTSKVVFPSVPRENAFAAISRVRAAALERNGVKLSDGKLLDLAEKFPDRIVDAVDAWLEWAGKRVIEKPTESLRSAIASGWQPDKKQVSRPIEVNPPTPDILSRLRQKFATVLQMPWGNSECWGAYVPNLNCTIPWWEAEKLLT